MKFCFEVNFCENVIQKTCGHENVMKKIQKFYIKM